MRAVLDTNVILAGLLSSAGASHQILRAIPTGLFDMLVSVPLLLEYESVLKRNDTLVETGLTLDEVDAFVDVLAKFSVPVTPFLLWRPMLRDPKDDMLLELAVAGAADCIVSFNIRDLLPARARFGIGLERPREFWKIIRR